MVTAIPVTGAFGSPALKVSRVCSSQGMPTCALMRPTTSCAVSGALLGAVVGLLSCPMQGAAAIVAVKKIPASFIIFPRDGSFALLRLQTLGHGNEVAGDF